MVLLCQWRIAFLLHYQQGFFFFFPNQPNPMPSLAQTQTHPNLVFSLRAMPNRTVCRALPSKTFFLVSFHILGNGKLKAWHSSGMLYVRIYVSQKDFYRVYDLFG